MFAHVLLAYAVRGERANSCGELTFQRLLCACLDGFLNRLLGCGSKHSPILASISRGRVIGVDCRLQTA